VRLQEAEQGQGLAASLLGAAAHAVHAVQEQLHSVLEHGRQLAAEHDAAASEGQAGGRSVTGAAEASELEGEQGEEGEDRRPEEQEKEGAVEGAAAGQEGAAASAPPPHTMKVSSRSSCVSGWELHVCLGLACYWDATGGTFTGLEVKTGAESLPATRSTAGCLTHNFPD
jgi:hypothetical protein